MESIEGRKLINKIQKGLIDSGLVVETVISDLKELRPFALEKKDPTLTKVIRLTYEHIENNEGFHIPVPADELVDDEGNETGEAVITEASSIESLDYLLSLFAKSDIPANREELKEYRDALLAYAED